MSAKPIAVVKTADRDYPYSVHGLVLGRVVKLNLTEAIMLQSQLVILINTDKRGNNA